ncbi:MAG: tetratricopeptide repeat protein [Acidobacteriota bacterium]
MCGDGKLAQATRLWQEGCQSLSDGNVKKAIELYTRSIEVCPTAEGYTFRGWAMSFEGRVDEAISECMKAIDVDSSFGNPYNDIGCYLMQQGDLDEAVVWLQRAKQAIRYESPHFPYLNLGRIFVIHEMYAAALKEFEQAQKLHPHDPVAGAAIRALKKAIQ